MTGGAAPSRLARRIGERDAIVIGLGSMVGAGVFSAFGPAAAAAGSGLLIGLAIAAVVALCNATSSAQLAALYPQSGGTYVYGRERLGVLWGNLAGFCFVIGKTASCAAMALTVGAYLAPAYERQVAIAAVVGLTAVNYRGIQKTASVTRVIVAIVLGVLALVVIGAALSDHAAASHFADPLGEGVDGILRSAALLFFAFAGYARIATLGEEVIDPERTIPRAISRALAITLVVYAAVAVGAIVVAGPVALAASQAPLATTVRLAGVEVLVPVVRVGGGLAALGVLLALIAGVGRTSFAMASDGVLPRWFAAVHPRFAVPHRAELAVASVVVALVSVTDLRHTISFSSFAVLLYYAIANASAWTLEPAHRRWPRALSGLGFVGCVVLAIAAFEIS